MYVLGSSPLQPPSRPLRQVVLASQASEIDRRLHGRVQKGPYDGGLSDRPASVLPSLPAAVLQPVQVSLLQEDGRLSRGGLGLFSLRLRRRPGASAGQRV